VSEPGAARTGCELATETGFLVTPAGKVEYVLHRPGDAPDRPVLVLLHEGLGCVSMWGRFPRELAARAGCPVLAYSRMGFGRSDPDPAPRAIDFMHREAWRGVPAVLEAAGVERFVLIGHSDGGSIAAIYGASPAVRSPGLQALVLIAAHAFNEPRCVAGIERAATAYAGAGLREALARHHHARVDEVFVRWHDVWLDPAFRGWTIERCLPAIETPLLVIQGREDEYGTLAQVDAIASGVAGPVETLVLDACGHVPHREQPERTLGAVVDFVRRVDATRNATPR
jgi:pimeloyl-ACP methyl ester carboxylesterase